MCDCNDCNTTHELNCCEMAKVEETCNCEYLKPLTIDSLYDKDTCTDYTNALEKAKKIRNAFFAAKASIYNFVNDCDTIADSITSDMSNNENELNTVRQQYFVTLNNLMSSLYASLKTSQNGKNIVNVDIAKILTGEAERPQKSTDIKVRTENHDSAMILAHVPGVSIQFNKDNKSIKIKFSEPANISGLSKHGSVKKEKDITKTFILAPNIFCTDDYELYTEDLSMNMDMSLNILDLSDNHCLPPGTFSPTLESGKDVFQNIDIAKDFFEEIQGYQDNYVMDADMSYGNEIFEIMSYLERTITKIESTHKYIVQLCRIQTKD